MIIQDVKKECLANVGLSIEFSNSEIDSITMLVRSLNDAIEKGCKDLASMVSHSQQLNSDLIAKDKGAFGNTAFTAENAVISVDLKSLVRAFSLLDDMTKHRAFKPSKLFDECDASLINTIEKINQGGV